MIRSNTGTGHPSAASKDMQLFQSLAEPAAPARALSASVGIHGILLLLVVVLPLLAPQALTLNYHTVMLAPPPHERPHTEIVPLKTPTPPKPLQPPRDLLVEKLPEPKLIAPKVLVPEIPKPAPLPKPEALTAVPIPPTAVPKPTPAPQPAVVTNVFSSVAPAAAHAPARTLEAAGFGEVNGTERARTTKIENVAKVEGFDAGLASEHGRTGKPDHIGNVAGFDVGVAPAHGSGGKGESIGKVAGFDIGVAGGTGRGHSGKAENVGRVGGFDVEAGRGGTGNHGSVADSGFGAVAKAPANSPKPVAQGNIEKPVEILTKPRPDYTDEARQMRLEGEVLLRVLFTSSGEARVLDLIRGLGHGLNENAIRAAEQIRFKPAQRDGQASDSSAIVHIVFQLAY